MDILFSILIGILSAAIVLAVFGVYIYVRLTKNIEIRIKNERSKATQLSRNIVKGQLAEQMFPILQTALYDYHLGDMLFIGKLIDYVIVDGYNDAKDNDGEIKSVIFLDVKTGNAKLSKHQEKLKEAIEAGRVEWKTITIENNGNIREHTAI